MNLRAAVGLSKSQLQALSDYYAHLVHALSFGDALRETAQQNRLTLRDAKPGIYPFGQQLSQQRIQCRTVTDAKPIHGGPDDDWPTYG